MKLEQTARLWQMDKSGKPAELGKVFLCRPAMAPFTKAKTISESTNETAPSNQPKVLNTPKYLLAN